MGLYNSKETKFVRDKKSQSDQILKYFQLKVSLISEKFLERLLPSTVTPNSRNSCAAETGPY